MATKKQFLQEPEERQESGVRSEEPAMSGHPAEEQTPPETPPAAPSVREVTINGRKFQVDPEMAEAMAQRDRDFDRKLNEHANELGQLRKLAQGITQSQPPAPKGYDQLLFEDPVGAVNRLKAEIRQEYVQEKKLEQFWNRFYRSNKDLDRDEDEFIVKAILNENIQTLANLPEEDAAARLADLSRRQILKYQARQKEDEQESARTRVETPSRTTPRAAAPKDEGPTTITQLIKERRAARQKTG